MFFSKLKINWILTRWANAGSDWNIFVHFTCRRLRWIRYMPDMHIGLIAGQCSWNWFNMWCKPICTSVDLEWFTLTANAWLCKLKQSSIKVRISCLFMNITSTVCATINLLAVVCRCPVFRYTFWRNVKTEPTNQHSCVWIAFVYTRRRV